MYESPVWYANNLSYLSAISSENENYIIDIDDPLPLRLGGIRPKRVVRRQERRENPVGNHAKR